MKLSSLVHDIRSATNLVNNIFSFFLENRTLLEKKHHVCDLESTETVKCLNEDSSRIGQNISWYNGSTGVEIKSGGRIELNGLFLKIKNVQLDDAGTYECRGVFSTRFYTIYVNSEFPYSPVLRHFYIIFITLHHLIQETGRCNTRQEALLPAK